MTTAEHTNGTGFRWTREPPAPWARDHPAARELAGVLSRDLAGEVSFTAGDRALYATDASNYRQVPIGVVRPRDAGDVEATLAACRAVGAPVLGRGGGTSLAGQCCNVAVVLDFSRHMNRVLEVDPERRLARVEPGLVLDELQAVVRPRGLAFGPDPATHSHCTLGGMIGNNSCGVRSVLAGKTVDNVRSLEVLTWDGARLRVGPTGEQELARLVAAGGRRGEIYRGMAELRDRHAELIRERFPDVPRRVSGYNLDQLLPENGFHGARALVGSESTLALTLEATVELVPWPSHRVLVVAAFEDVYAAADAVPEILEAGPMGLEGLDDRLIADQRKKGLNLAHLDLLPEGRGWLLVELGGDDPGEAAARAERAEAVLARLPGHRESRRFEEPEQQERLWQVRESGLGATARVPGQRDTWPGWEDSAVPPETMGSYLRELRALFERYGYEGSFYGHFGDGCLHTRVSFDLASASGVERYREFAGEAAELVTRYGGSLSGEHGDGQARGELLPVMYGEDLCRAFGEMKALWDPAGRMNPGKVAEPYPLDSNLRLGADYHPWEPETRFDYPDDDFRFSRAALRCVGVGKCRRHESGVMCPSYMVTREERHSTRGRARLLFEMLQGEEIGDGWRSREVEDALHLCLSCKGCKTECPVGVDMATYKAEFLYHHYRRRLRPRSAYALGLVHWWSRLASRAPRLANALARAPGTGRLAKALAGVAPERSLPAFAPETFRRWFAERASERRDGPRAVPFRGLGGGGAPSNEAGREEASSGEPLRGRSPAEPTGAGPGGKSGRALRSVGGAASGAAERGRVLLWPDTFHEFFRPETARAAVEVLEVVGFTVDLPPRILCCGRPLYDFGMLDLAERQLRQVLDVLRDDLRAGVPVVGLEPSCVATFRDELPNLLPHDEDARRLAERTVTLAELLEERAPDWTPPRVERRALVHRHCHHASVLGFDADRRVLDRLGLDHRVLDSGCCGMAGAFGYEAGERYQVSIACAERALAPAVRAAAPETLIVADGFSCRSQIEETTGRRPLHLAEVLRMALG